MTLVLEVHFSWQFHFIKYSIISAMFSRISYEGFVAVRIWKKSNSGCVSGVCVYLWVVFLETYRYVTRWLGSMSHEREREQRLWTVSLYTCFPITFLFSFSWKIRSRFYSTWASHHCASPRRRISSKRRSVEYPTLMCVMRWGSGYVDENVPSKKASLSLSLEDIKKETVHTTMAACDG